MYLNQFSWHHRPNIHQAISSAGMSGSAVFSKASQVARPLAMMCVWWPSANIGIKPSGLSGSRSSLIRVSLGTSATVVEELTLNVFEAEFCDNQGRTYACLALAASQLLVLHHESAALC